MKTVAALLLSLLVLPLALCDAQIISGVMQGRAYVIDLLQQQNNSTSADWSDCYIGGCGGGTPGGNDAPVSAPTWTAVSTPSLSGTSIQYSYTTTSTATQTNVLKIYKTHVVCNCNYYYMDMWVYPANIGVINSLEFDDALFDTAANLEYMMGGQCVTSTGNMNQWNQATGHWITGPASCSFPSATWTHFQRLTHVSGSNYCYDWVAINGVVTKEGQCFPAGTLPVGWADENLYQVQIDSSNASATPTVYYDKINFQVWR